MEDHILSKKDRGGLVDLRSWMLWHEGQVAAILLILAAAARLIALTGLPAGLNQDEASAGYEAWALLNYGMTVAAIAGRCC